MEQRRCPVCRNTGPNELILIVDAGSPAQMVVSRCEVCASLLTGRPPQDMTETEAAIDSYVEATAGIGTIGERLYLLDPASVTSLLDVGCGYGFGADLGAFLFGWRTVGVEPSAAGRRGARDLGLDIRDGYVTTEPLLGGPFDAVLASEVLEHVVDPFGLLTAMRAQLSPGGVVVLTTPAAEVVNPASSVQTITEVLSVPFHHFIASVGGLERLLHDCGFGAVTVTRFGATLVAMARVEPGELTLQRARPVPAERLEEYLLHRASTAAPGSALELGCVTRAVRSMVARGAFDAAVAAHSQLSTAFLRRTGHALDEPTELLVALREGRPPALSLPGAAFAIGMTEMLHHRRPHAAIEWFALAEAAALHLRASGELVDIDSLDLVGQSAGHAALCAAGIEGGGQQALDALDRLAAVLTRDEVAWWSCRAFVESLSRGLFDVGEVLLGRVAAVAHSVAASPVESRRRAGLDALFTWGVLRLVRHHPREALQLFTACIHGCAELANPASANDLLAEATRHAQLARDEIADEPGHHHVVAQIEGGTVNAVLETFWCDAHGMHLAGWMTASGRRWAQLGVKVGETVHWTQPVPRPDVLPLTPDAGDDLVGLSVYVDGLPPTQVAFVGRTEQGELVESFIALPSRSLPIITTERQRLEFLDMLELAPPGPVLIIGARAAEERTRVDEGIRERSGREVVVVDIHAGIGVDVVADAHVLSQHFAPGHFAVTTSSAVLEHLEVPWLVAAECAAVTMPGGLAIHTAPFVWPAHAQPNDFWRFSPAGLAVLFGPATGYEVVAHGSENAAVVLPDPSWRGSHLTMPTLRTNAVSWVVSRRTAAPVPGVGWTYDATAGAARAAEYPPSGLQQHVTGDDAWGNG